MMAIHSLFLGVPLLLAAILAAMIWSRKGPRPATYTLPDPWKHAPVLWAATDEQVSHGASEFSVGGGASGKW